MSRDIHYLRLNESKKLENGVVILRVPGYWIYMLPNGSSEKIEISSEFSKKNTIKITKERVVTIIGKYLNLLEGFHLEKKTHGVHVRGKQILIKILYENLRMNYFDIADYLKYNSHSSPVHSLQTTNRILENDLNFKKDYQDILRKVLQFNQNIKD